MDNDPVILVGLDGERVFVHPRIDGDLDEPKLLAHAPIAGPPMFSALFSDGSYQQFVVSPGTWEKLWERLITHSATWDDAVASYCHGIDEPTRQMIYEADRNYQSRWLVPFYPEAEFKDPERRMPVDRGCQRFYMRRSQPPQTSELLIDVEHENRLIIALAEMSARVMRPADSRVFLTDGLLPDAGKKEV